MQARSAPLVMQSPWCMYCSHFGACGISPVAVPCQTGAQNMIWIELNNHCTYKYNLWSILLRILIWIEIPILNFKFWTICPRYEPKRRYLHTWGPKLKIMVREFDLEWNSEQNTPINHLYRCFGCWVLFKIVWRHRFGRGNTLILLSW